MAEWLEEYLSQFWGAIRMVTPVSYTHLDVYKRQIYERILERLSGKEIRFVVDATKDLLLKVMKYHPFLIKPNNHELDVYKRQE